MTLTHSNSDSARPHLDDWLRACTPEGTYNVSQIDFTDYRAFVLYRADKLLIADIVLKKNEIDFETMDDDEPWIVLGKSHALPNGNVSIPKAYLLNVAQFARIQHLTNYHPVDCLRGYILEALLLAPYSGINAEIYSSSISEVFDLGENEVCRIYIEGDIGGLLTSTLKSDDMKKRALCASKQTVATGLEHSFSVYRHPLNHGTAGEFAYGAVIAGDYDSVSPERRFKEVLKDSSLITHLDLCRKYGIEESWEDLLNLKNANTEQIREIEIAQNNEFEILKLHQDEFIPGAFENSIEEKPVIDAGPGFYRLALIHSHPIIDNEGNIEPSSADLKALYEQRDKGFFDDHPAFGTRERIVHSPIFIIIQPAEESGKSFYGLIIRPDEVRNPETGSIDKIPDDSWLLENYAKCGVPDTLFELGLVATKFKFSNGRYYPPVPEIAAALDKIEGRIGA